MSVFMGKIDRGFCGIWLIGNVLKAGVECIHLLFHCKYIFVKLIYCELPFIFERLFVASLVVCLLGAYI